MTFEADTLGPLPVPLKSLAEIYKVSSPALRKLGKRLQLRIEFLSNPYAVRSWLIRDGASRGRIRRMVFDEAECIRISEAVENIRYPN